MFIKQNGFRIFIIAIVLILQLAWFTSCGLSDWSYQLPNNYEILRVNSETIVFGKNSDRYERILDSYIYAFCFNDSYIGLKRVPIETDTGMPYNLEELDLSKTEYYLFDAIQDIQYGPYSKEEYLNKCQELAVIEMCDWIESQSIGKDHSYREDK